MEYSVITVRVPTSLKEDAENLFGQMGLTMTGAVNCFLRQSVREQQIPFQPSTRTITDDWADTSRVMEKWKETFELLAKEGHER